MRKNIRALLAAAVLAAFLLPPLAAGQGARAAEAPDAPRIAADTADSDTDIVEDSDTDTDAPPAVTPAPGSDDIQPPNGGTGWRYVPQTGDYYYFKDYVRKGDYWVGFADGASKWANNWYYADATGKLLTGFQYLDDLKGGKGWYMLQMNNANGEIGKMLSGWQWTYSAAGTGYFSPKYGSQGLCTYTTVWGSYSAASGLWGDGLAHRGT